MAEPQDREGSGAAFVAAPGSLCIALLGGFRVFAGDNVVDNHDWRLSNARNIVKLLALAKGHQAHREEVIEFFWPDLDPPAATNNLHQALYAARRALAVVLPSGTPTSIVMQHQIVALRSPVPLWIDVEAFETAAIDAFHARNIGRGYAALELYRGDLLPEDSYEEWTVARREALRSQYIGLLAHLARLHEERLELDDGIRLWQRLLGAEPSDEAAHTGLMRLYARSGQTSLALRQYDLLTTALERDLDAEPGSDTQQLYAAILDHRYPPADQSTAITSGSIGMSSTTMRHRLPVPITTLVGRDAEVDEVSRVLATKRLVTLTGPGGIGKTRVALAVANRLAPAYDAGTVFVSLAPVREPDLVVSSIASAIDVRPTASHTLHDAIVTAIGGRQMLLILDNVEQVATAGPAIAELLESCPRLAVLMTSRMRLRIRGEHEFLLRPLDLPELDRIPDLETIGMFSAVALFIDRSRDVSPGYCLTPDNALVVATICHRLDGLPLAIELAAARSRNLSPGKILQRLDDRLEFLSQGAVDLPPRQQTIRAAIAWSYDLLDPEEQQWFRQLAVFASGWTVPAAIAVCASGSIAVEAAEDRLSSLADQSLIDRTQGSRDGEDLRFTMLETIREYGMESLAGSGEAHGAFERLSGWLLALAAEAERNWYRADESLWLNRIEREHGNIRAALDFLSGQGRWQDVLQLACSLRVFWSVHSHLDEGRSWIERALAFAGTSPNHMRSKALSVLADLVWFQMDVPCAVALGEEALAIARLLDDREVIARTQMRLGSIARAQGEVTASERLVEALTIFEQLGDATSAALTLINLGDVARGNGELELASDLLTRAQDISEHEHFLRGMAVAPGYLGDVARDLGDLDRAEALYRRGLVLSRELGDKSNLSDRFADLAALAAQRNLHQRASLLFGAAEALRESFGSAPEGTRWLWDAVGYGPAILMCQDALGDDLFAEAWQSGRALSLAAAIDVALSTDPV